MSSVKFWLSGTELSKKKIHYVCKGESEEETSKMKRNGDSQRAC